MDLGLGTAHCGAFDLQSDSECGQRPGVGWAEAIQGKESIMKIHKSEWCLVLIPDLSWSWSWFFHQFKFYLTVKGSGNRLYLSPLKPVLGASGVYCHEEAKVFVDCLLFV